MASYSMALLILSAAWPLAAASSSPPLPAASATVGNAALQIKTVLKKAMPPPVDEDDEDYEELVPSKPCPSQSMGGILDEDDLAEPSEAYLLDTQESEDDLLAEEEVRLPEGSCGAPGAKRSVAALARPGVISR